MPNTPEQITPELAFATILRNRRLALGLKQIDLEADDVMDRSYISKLELGKRQVCLRGILHLAKALHMTPGQLIDEVNGMLEPEGKAVISP